MGLSATQLEAILHRADTDTAHEAFLALKMSKATREMAEANPGLPLGEVKRRASSGKRKRQSVDTIRETGEESTPDTSEKRTRQESEAYNSFAYLFPDLEAFAVTPVQSPRETPRETGNYSQFVPNFGPNPFNLPNGFPQSQSVNTGFGLTVPATQPYPRNQPNDFAEPVDEAERQKQLRAAVAHLTSGQGQFLNGGSMSQAEVDERSKVQEELQKSLAGGDRFDRMTEGIQMITYHLNK